MGRFNRAPSNQSELAYYSKHALFMKAQQQFGRDKCPCCGVGMRLTWKSKAGRPTPRTLATRGHDVPLHADGPGDRYIYICWQCNNDQGVLTFAQWATCMKMNGDPRLNRVLAVVNFFEREAEPWRAASGSLSASLEQMRVVLPSRGTD